MQHLDLILTLTGGLAAALVLGYLTHRLRLSPIVGYLLAGIAVGPHTPGYIANKELADQLAEVGVILLMFGVGLHFHLRQLMAVRRVAIPGAVGQIVAATLLGALVGRAFGWDWASGIVFGLAISVASTVVLIRVLSDNRDLHTPEGHIAVGWLVVEDLFTVAVLVLLPALFGSTETSFGRVILELLLAAAKVVALAAFTLVVGGRVIPWLLSRVAATRSRELFTLTVLVVALGIAVGAAKGFGVSMALGAFLAGMVVGRSEFSLRAAAEALPMRDAFAVLFFVSVGMLFDPHILMTAPLLVAATLAVIVVGKPLAAYAIVWFLRYPPKTGFVVGAALAQIGEFSFMLAILANQLGVLPQQATQTLVAAAILSITFNPLMYRAVDPVLRWAAGNPKLWGWLNRRRQSRSHPATTNQKEDSTDPRYRAVVIGYGPVGQTVSRLLRDNDIEPTVIELNLDTVRKLRKRGISAVYGDARHRDTLKGAGVHGAGSLILGASHISGSEEIIRAARELNPEIRIFARSDYVRDVPSFRSAGADSVFSSEAEVALALTVAILRNLGATPEQIDQERERVYVALLGQPLSPPETTESALAIQNDAEIAPPGQTDNGTAEPEQATAEETRERGDSSAG